MPFPLLTERLRIEPLGPADVAAFVACASQNATTRHESRQIDGDHSKGEWTTLDGYAILTRELTARR